MFNYKTLTIVHWLNQLLSETTFLKVEPHPLPTLAREWPFLDTKDDVMILMRPFPPSSCILIKKLGFPSALTRHNVSKQASLPAAICKPLKSVKELYLNTDGQVTDKVNNQC